MPPVLVLIHSVRFMPTVLVSIHSVRNKGPRVQVPLKM
jgi:hypothetical protein